MEDFIVLPENKILFDFIRNYDISNDKLPKIFAISGPQSSGKTHLASIWKNRLGADLIKSSEIERLSIENFSKPTLNNAYVLEDVDKIAGQEKLQKMLFYLYNIAQDNNFALLITSKIPLKDIEYKFPDIASRFKNVYSLEIESPSTDMIKMLLIKNFSAKQMLVQDAVVEYLANNTNRSFELIPQLVKLLEFHCFERKRSLTIPLVKQIIAMQKPID